MKILTKAIPIVNYEFEYDAHSMFNNDIFKSL